MTAAAIRGIDVSSAQGDFDWTRAKEEMGLRFAIIKCTQGNDPWGEASRSAFQRRVYEALHAGIAVGAYHFAYPLPEDGVNKRRSAKEQAAAFFQASNSLGMGPSELPPSIDFEWPAYEDWGRWKVSAPQMLDWILECLAETERLFARTPMLYTYPYFWGKVGGALRDDFARYPLWMADYNWTSEAPGKVLTPWSKATIVQTSGGGGTLPNNARVDENIFVGDESAWNAFIGAGVDVTDGGRDKPIFKAP